MLTEIDKYVIGKVKEKRVEKGMSQSALAFELEMSNGVIGKIESGKYGKKYNVAQLNEIARVLDCSIRDFFPKGHL